MEKSLYSYHIFYFPFKWERKGFENETFSKRFDLSSIILPEDSDWINIFKPTSAEYNTELYNEKNYFYTFVHNVLYDDGEKNNIIKHFERKESYSNELAYEIKVNATGKENIYLLNLKSVVLNLYSTGTGILIFYIENNKYKDFKNILSINQFGRRVYPPFLGVQKGVASAKERELAEYISISGLNGSADRYFEDFNSYDADSQTWQAGKIIHSLIEDFSPELKIESVIDDRMHVVSWVGDNKQSLIAKKGAKIQNDDWYKYIFIDSGDCSCKNQGMKDKLIEQHTYMRWQEYGTLYGVSRYSLVMLSNDEEFSQTVLLSYLRTTYARMVELSLVQRASILKFSEEVTHLSELKSTNIYLLAEKISDFYKEYIKFVNQVYFREITAQEQGIELYEMIQEKMKVAEQVKDLESEIEELHQYAALLEDKQRNNILWFISIIGAIFIIPSFITSFHDMGAFKYNSYFQLVIKWTAFGLGVILSPILLVSYFKKVGIKKRYLFLILAIVFLLLALIIPLLN